MAFLKTISLGILAGIGLINIHYSADEKFTLLKYHGLEIKQPTFDSMLAEPNPFTTMMLKQGLNMGYQQMPETLGLFLPKDSFLIDLAFQYSGPFFTLFIKNKDLLEKLGEVSFLKSLGTTFSSTDLDQITDPQIKEAKNRAIHSFFPHVTDAQLQKFYGTIIVDAYSIEGLNSSNPRKAFQERINSLNRKEKIYKVHPDKLGNRAFKLKDNPHFPSANLLPLLNANVDQYILLESNTPFYKNNNVYRIKKIQLAPLAQVQKYRATMKAKLIETVGNSLYNFKKAELKPFSYFPDIKAKLQVSNLSSELPVVKCDIEFFHLSSKLIDGLLKFNSAKTDPLIASYVKDFVKYCNEKERSVSVDEIKEDRNVVRLLALTNVILNEFFSPILSQISFTQDSFIKQRIKYLEVLNEVQHPLSTHLLLAELYSETKNSKAPLEIEEYLKKDGLSQASYLPLTNQLIEERAKKVQTILDQLKDLSEDKQKDLKELLEKSKTTAVQKTKS